MKRYLGLAVAALMLVLVAPSAFAVRIRIVDPIPDVPNGYVCDGSTAENSNIPCNIYALGYPFEVKFVSCSHDGIPAQAGFTYCLWLNNVPVDESTANTFTFSFKVPKGGSLDVTDTLDCDSAATPSAPNFSATDNCHGAAVAGNILSVTFHTTPGVAYGSNIWLYTNFINNPGTASVTASVPEPGALGLFGLGLLAIGFGFGWEKRRRGHQVGSTA